MAENVIDKVVASTTTGGGGSSTPKTDASVTSGTASEALIKAASSVADEPQLKADPAATLSGDIPPKTGAEVEPGADAATTEQPKVGDGAAKPAADAPEARITAATRNARTQLALHIGTEIGLVGNDGQPRSLNANDLPDLKVGMGLLSDLKQNSMEFFLTLGKHLGVEFPEEKAETYDFPKASLRSEDGQEAYSAKDMMAFADVLERKITSQLTGKIDPLLRGAETQREMQARDQVIRDSRVQAGQVLTDMRARPHFKTHEKEIAERLVAMDPRVKKSLGAAGALFRAYNDVLAEKVFPSIETNAVKTVREDNARKAAGSSIIHPAAGGGDPKKPTLNSVDDLARHMEHLASAS